MGTRACCGDGRLARPAKRSKAAFASSSTAPAHLFEMASEPDSRAHSPAPLHSPVGYRFCTGNRRGIQSSGERPRRVRSWRSPNRSISMESCQLRTTSCSQPLSAECMAASEFLQACRKNRLRRQSLDHHSALPAFCGERRRRRRVEPGVTQTG